MHLPENSISSWADLCHQFVGAFTGGHKPHGQESDLHLLAQKEGEPLRNTSRDSAKCNATSQTSTLPRSSVRSTRTCVTAGCGRRWRCARSETSVSCMPWPTDVHVLRKGGNSSEREQGDLTAMMPPRQAKTSGGTT